MYFDVIGNRRFVSAFKGNRLQATMKFRTLLSLLKKEFPYVFENPEQSLNDDENLNNLIITQLN